MPLFVKEGSIIPVGPEIQYTGEKPADPLTLYVFTGSDAEFILYEDENVNCNYKKELYSQIPIKYDHDKQTLTIGKRKGKFPGMIKNRTLKIIQVSPGREKAMDFGLSADEEVNYKGKEIKIRL